MFWSSNDSACVVYTKTIIVIHLSVSQSDGYWTWNKNKILETKKSLISRKVPSI